MEYAIPHERALAIANLQLGDKLKIAFQLTKARWLPYMLALLLMGVGMTVAWSLNFVLMMIIIGFLTIIPLAFITIFIIIGYHASILRHMDGLEPSINPGTFFEPCKRWLSIAVPVLVVYLVLWVISFILQLFVIVPFVGFFIYSLASLFLTMIQAAYIFYWADNREGSMEEHLTRPFKLFFRHILCWISAMLCGLIGYIPFIVLMIVYLVVLSMMFPSVELGEPDTFWAASSIAFSVIMFIVMFIALAAGFIFATFLYAIAYKQSRAREQLLRPYTPPPAPSYFPPQYPPYPHYPANPANPTNPFNPGGPPSGVAGQSGPQAPQSPPPANPAPTNKGPGV